MGSLRTLFSSLARFKWERLLFVFVALAIGVLILVPLGMLLLGSFSPGFEELGRRLTLQHYIDVYSNVRYYTALRNTLLMAAAVTVLATALGGGLAWLVGRVNIPGAQLLESLIMIPLFIPPMLGALGWALAVRPEKGIISVLVEAIRPGAQINLYSPWGIIWVLSLYMAPYAFVFVVSSLRSMDPALEEAASVVGLGVMKTAFRISLPLARPALLSATLLIFISVSGQFGVPLIFGVPANFYVITTRIFSLTVSWPARWAEVAALSTMLLTITMLGVLLQVIALGRGLRQYATITGRGYRTGRVDLGRWRFGAAGLVWLYVVVGVVVPIGTLILLSLLPQYGAVYSVAHLTLENYTRMLKRSNVTESILNSLAYSTIAASLGVALTSVAAWIVYRSQIWGRGILEYVCMVPLAIPQTVLAVAFLWTIVHTPIYGTMWALIVAYVAGFIPFSIRSILPAMTHIDASLEEIGRICGLNWFQIFGKVVVPLSRRSLSAAWLLLFITFIKELPASIMLYTPRTWVMSVAIYDQWTQGRYHLLAALATMQIGLIVTVVLLVSRWTGGEVTRGV
jgi:iron(III) transport system permease protein